MYRFLVSLINNDYKNETFFHSSIYFKIKAGSHLYASVGAQKIMIKKFESHMVSVLELQKQK